MTEDQKEFNPFDEIKTGVEFDPKEIEKLKAEQKAIYNKRDYLIHRVFEQTEDGRELLKNWIDTCLIRMPVLTKGAQHDSYDIGIQAGIQEFVRSILITCEKVEKGES